MKRVFLDANILFSAAYRESNALLGLWSTSEIHLVSSSYALAEAERNIRARRPEALARLGEPSQRIEVTNAICAVPHGYELAPKDTPILAAAIASNCDVLVTGDVKDFGQLLGSSIDGVHVVTFKMLLTEIDG